MLSWIYDSVSSALQELGLINKRGKLAFLGLDNAGKTTLLHLLKFGKLAQPQPTQHPTHEELRMVVHGVTFHAVDLGGHTEGQKNWRKHLLDLDGIVYLVDCADHARLAEAKVVLDVVLSDEQAAGVPILVLGNKIDRHEAVSEDTLRRTLGLYGRTTGKGKVPAEELSLRPMEVFMCSIVKQQGYGDGFRWLAQYINKKNRWLDKLRLPF